MNTTIVSILIALILVLGIWVGFLSYLLFKTLANYNRLTKGTTQQTLSEVLKKLLDHEDKSQATQKKIMEELDQIRKKNLLNIQKMSLIRYNPFSDVGGDQSFSLVLLDGHNTGLIITSLYARTGVRWYIKNIKNGKAEGYELSEEERQVLKKAVG